MVTGRTLRRQCLQPWCECIVRLGTLRACRAGVLGGYGFRGAGVWASYCSKRRDCSPAVLVPAPWLVRYGVTAALLYLSPYSKWRDCSVAVLVPTPWLVRNGVTTAPLYLSPCSKRRDCSAAVLVPGYARLKMTMMTGRLETMLNDDWKGDEPVAPCGGNAFSLRANALSVSAAYAACRAGVLGGYGLRGAGVWRSFGSKAA